MLDLTSFFSFFDLSTLFILHRIKEFNTCFKYLFKTSDRPNRQMLRMAVRRGNIDHAKAIKTFTEAYEILVHLCDLANIIYVKQTFTVFYGFAFITIFTGFSVYRHLSKTAAESSLLTLIMLSIDVYLTLFILIGMSICSKIAKCGKETGILVHNALNFTADEAIIDEVSVDRDFLIISQYSSLCVSFSFTTFHSKSNMDTRCFRVASVRLVGQCCTTYVG
jgi:hypothetical protein